MKTTIGRAELTLPLAQSKVIMNETLISILRYAQAV